MKLKSDVIILGGGLSGLILSYKLKDCFGIKTYVIEKGYNYKVQSGKYIIITRYKYPFSDETIKMIFKYNSSCVNSFEKEFSRKVYGIETEKFIPKRPEKNEEIVYSINTDKLIKDAYIYRNINVTSIDTNSKTIYGKILHMNKNVSIQYKYLFNTIPLFKFGQLAGFDTFRDFDIFTSYFPVGVKTYKTDNYSDNLIHEYYSDENIPFYRKHHYKNNIFYEYCLNKEMVGENFNFIKTPAKFLKIDNENLINFYEFLFNKDICMVGRYAVWNPDFVLDDIMCGNDESYSEYYNSTIEKAM